MLTTTVDPARVATALGQTAPDSGSVKFNQWSMWIDDALMLISRRVDSMDPVPAVNQDDLDYVVRQAVVARTERPADGAAQVTHSVDDASAQRTFRRGSALPDVEIVDEWWALLGLMPSAGGSFSVDLLPPSWTV